MECCIWLWLKFSLALKSSLMLLQSYHLQRWMMTMHSTTHGLTSTSDCVTYTAWWTHREEVWLQCDLEEWAEEEGRKKAQAPCSVPPLKPPIEIQQSRQFQLFLLKSPIDWHYRHWLRDMTRKESRLRAHRRQVHTEPSNNQSRPKRFDPIDWICSSRTLKETTE